MSARSAAMTARRFAPSWRPSRRSRSAFASSARSTSTGWRLVGRRRRRPSATRSSRRPAREQTIVAHAAYVRTAAGSRRSRLPGRRRLAGAGHRDDHARAISPRSPRSTASRRSRAEVLPAQPPHDRRVPRQRLPGRTAPDAGRDRGRAARPRCPRRRSSAFEQREQTAAIAAVEQLPAAALGRRDRRLAPGAGRSAGRSCTTSSRAASRSGLSRSTDRATMRADGCPPTVASRMCPSRSTSR